DLKSELLCEAKEGVMTLRLNRPQRRHALSLSLLQELERALVLLEEDRETRVVILAADGPVFSSGHDLGEMQNRSEEDYQQLFATCARVMQRLRSIPQPVIARVQGFATAAGCQLVAAC